MRDAKTRQQPRLVDCVIGQVGDVGMQFQPRLAASDALDWGRDVSDLQRCDLPHRIPSFSSLIGFIVWIHVSITKEGLGKRRADTLSEDYGNLIGLNAPSEIRVGDQS